MTEGAVELKRVDIRQVWPGEARDFTPWLADHLDVLGSHLDVGELTLESTEVPIPGGRALDVLAVDHHGRKWAIENQYGVSDHDHLTRGLAYAVALECRALVVIAEDHRDEFVAVADEWNRYSEAYGEEGIRVFLAVVEAWTIADSPPGFKFRLVAGPNEWRVAAQASARRTTAQTERNEANYSFWSDLLPAMNEATSLFRPIGPRTGSFLDVRSGPFHYQIWLRQDDCYLQLRIDTGDVDDNAALYEELERSRDEVDERFGMALEWDPGESYRACFVKHNVENSAGWRTPPAERQPGIQRVVEAMVRFHGALDEFVARLG